MIRHRRCAVVLRDHQTVIATAAPAHAFSDAEGSYLSALDLDHDGTVGSLRVQVHIASDQPEQLRLRLLAPDGSSVLLHDHGPGSVPDIDGLTRFGALWGTYPDGMAPVQSLGTAAGSPIRGRWILELAGDGGSTGRVSANLLDWSLEITPRTSPPRARRSWPSSIRFYAEPALKLAQGVFHL